MNVAELKTKHVSDELRQSVDYVPTLVVCLHPELERVGEVAPLYELLQQGRDYVSRSRPDFAQNGYAGKPLNDPHISRSPIIFQQDDGGTLRIRAHSTSTKVDVVGRAHQTEYLLSVSDLDAGVSIILNRTVVLLLKRLPTDETYLPKNAQLKGLSPDIQAVRKKLQQVAELSVPVMIRGAVGSGKELAAYSLHQSSSRSERPFISVNLAAIHDVVAEEELFGCVSGSRDTLGYLGQAQDGTLLLEDLEDASEHVQELLLNAINSGYYVASGDDTPRPLNCRLVVTSIYDAPPCTEDSRLWQLSNRLAPYQLFLPSLTERAEDISLLFLHFVQQQWQRLYPSRAFDIQVPAELMGQLLVFHWPGNVRQLRNVARQVVIDSREQDSLQLDPQLLSILQPRPDNNTAALSRANNHRKPNTIGRDEVLAALENNRFELQATARELNISRASVYQLIQRFDGINTAQDIDEEVLVKSYQQQNGDTERMMWQLKVSQIGLRRRLKAMGYAI